MKNVVGLVLIASGMFWIGWFGRKVVDNRWYATHPVLAAPVSTDECLAGAGDVWKVVNCPVEETHIRIVFVCPDYFRRGLDWDSSTGIDLEQACVGHMRPK
jgi:hypothetical protein